MIFKISTLPAVIVAGLLIAANAQAALCVPGPGTTSDLTFRGNDSDACSIQSGNDDASNIPFADPLEPWQFLVKDDIGTSGGADLTGTFGGATFTLSDDLSGAASSGNWSLSWTTPADLTIDLAVVIKGSNNFGAFLFENEVFAAPSGGGNGTYNISFLNNGGNIPNLSHLAIYVRDAEGGIPPQVVPIPAAAWLFGSALLGVVGISRRRKV